MALRTVIDLGETPIIKDIVAKLAALLGRTAAVETVQAATAAKAAEALAKAQQALDLLANGGVIAPPVPIKVTISGTPSLTGQVGQAYSFTPTTADGSGIKVFSLASGTLLGGMSFNTTTGAITGSPTVAGLISNLSIRVTDSTGSATTTPVSVTIATAPVVATLDNTLIGSTLSLVGVQGAVSAFDSLETTADEQDARLDQLEVA